MNRFSAAVLAIAFASGCTLRAQNNPLSADAKADYAQVPAPGVRSFGQIIADVADDQYNLCAPVMGETGHAAYSK